MDARNALNIGRLSQRYSDTTSLARMTGRGARGGLDGIYGGAAPMWPQPTNIVLAAAGTWTTPLEQCVDARGAVDTFLLVMIDSLTTSGGNVDIALQSCVVASTDDNAWKTIASASTISATGPQVLKATLASTQVVTGYLRLRVTCNTAAVTLNVRGELLLKRVEAYESGDWVDGLPVNLAASATWTMHLDWMLDASRHLSAYVLLTWSGSNGSGVTASLLTAPAISADANMYATVDSETLSATAVLLDGRRTGSVSPMGVLRLKPANAGPSTATGLLRAQYLLKEV